MTQDSKSRFDFRHLLWIVPLLVVGFPMFVPSRYYGDHPKLLRETHTLPLELKTHVLMALAGLLAYMVYPRMGVWLGRLRAGWKPAYSAIVLAATSVAMIASVMVLGNREFGAWDEGLLVDTSWRQYIGQRPYTDFLTPNPPGFNLGAKFAFKMFGVSWNAELYLTAIFTVLSFVWMYWLLKRLTGRRAMAFLIAVALQLSINIELSFWWYNNATETLAVLFFLSCALLCVEPDSKYVQFSFYNSLWVFALMKPNAAGLLITTGLLLTLVATPRKVRLVLLTVAATATTLVVLSLNHVSVAAMMACYRAAAIERGLTFFGLADYDRLDRVRILLWWLVMAVPVFAMGPVVVQALRLRQWSRAAMLLLFPVVAIGTLYGLATNNDMKDVEYAKLLAAGGVALFSASMAMKRPGLQRAYVALVFAMMASAGYASVTRMRVAGVKYEFFEWNQPIVRVQDPFFASMRANNDMNVVMGEIADAVAKNPGPVFFGSRLEMEYAVKGVPSPEHLPLYWQVGTSFARRDTDKMVGLWNDQHFQTLIMLKWDHMGYPGRLATLIHKEYSQDDRYSRIVVYHLRQP